MPTLFCKIELDKNRGILVSVDNQAGDTQTITIDGRSIVARVQGAAGVSTITQDADSVTVECNRFVVRSNTIECTASQTASIQATQSLTLDGGLSASLSATSTSVSGTADLSLDGGAAATLNASAITVTSIEALTMTAPAGEASLTALNVTITGEVAAELDSPVSVTVTAPDLNIL